MTDDDQDESAHARRITEQLRIAERELDDEGDDPHPDTRGDST